MLVHGGIGDGVDRPVDEVEDLPEVLARGLLSLRVPGGVVDGHRASFRGIRVPPPAVCSTSRESLSLSRASRRFCRTASGERPNMAAISAGAKPSTMHAITSRCLRGN